ncbi:MAG: hypothetical protein WCK48_03620 [bacterium]
MYESPQSTEQTLLSQMEALVFEAKRKREELSLAIEGKDEERQKTLTKEIQDILSQCNKIRKEIEGEITEEATISVDYTYTEEKSDQNTGETITESKTEKITLDIEKEIDSFTEFYNTYSIDLPPNFKQAVIEIWNKNRDEIHKAIEQDGFNTILIVPETLPSLPQLHTQMTEGYNATYKGSGFTAGGSFEGVIEDRSTKPRIILVHKEDLWQHPAMKGTLNKKIETYLEQGQSLTLSDYLVLQRKIYDETGEHIDTKSKVDNLYFYTALPGSKVPNPSGGFRVVCACWSPGSGRLYVDAVAPDDSDPYLGCRPSRSFF